VTKGRTTAVLCVFAVLLTGWWVLVERPRMWEKVYPGRLFGNLIREDLEKIEILKPKETVLLVKGQDDKWRLEKPILYPAGRGPVDTMVGAIVFLEAKRFLDKAEGAFPKTGPRIVLNFKARGKLYTVEIGNRHLTEPLTYYRVGDRLFLGDEALKQYCDRTLYDWRDKSVCPLSPDYVGAVRIEGSKGTIILERSRRGVWFMRKPETARADAAKVRSLLDGLNTLAAREFLNDDGKEDPAKYGLNPPVWRVKVKSLNGREEYEILLGKRIDRGKNEPGEIYARRTDRIQIFRCEDTASALLARAPSNLRDLRVLPFEDYGWVKRISVRGYGRDFSLYRPKENAEWTGVVREGGEPRQFPSTKERARRLVDEAANLKIAAFRPGENIGAERFRISVDVDGLSEPMTCVFGKEIEKNRYLVRRKGVEGEPDVAFEVVTSLPKRIGETGWVLYRSTVMAEIPDERFLHFGLITRRKKWLLLRFTKWQADGFENVPLDQKTVIKAAEVVRKPTAAFLEPGPGPLADLGLDRVHCRLRVKLYPGFGDYPYHEFFVGKQVDPPKALSYGKLDSVPIVFIFDPTPLFKLAEYLESVCGEKNSEK